MRQFSLEEASKMSQNEIMAIVCEGLAEVAHKLSPTQEPEFKGLQHIFEILSRKGLGHAKSKATEIRRNLERASAGEYAQKSLSKTPRIRKRKR